MEPETRHQNNVDNNFINKNSSFQNVNGKNKQISNDVSQSMNNAEDHPSLTQFKAAKVCNSVNSYYERDVRFTPENSAEILLERAGKKGDVATLDVTCTSELETLQIPGLISDKSNISNDEFPSIDMINPDTKMSSPKIEEGKEFDSQLMSALVLFFSDNTNEKKSILANRGEQGTLKKVSSKAINWEDGVERKLEEQPLKCTRTSSTPASQLGLLMTRGSRWKNIHSVVSALQMEEGKLVKEDSAEKQFAKQEKEISFLIRELGTNNLSKRQYVELTLEQKSKLKEMNDQVKLKNDTYLNHHPELGVLLSLIYKQLFKHLPDNPIHFVANYVHHLNTHREELILEPDIDIPFDRVQTAEEIIHVTPSQDKEQVKQFARKLVLSCMQISSQGIPYVNVKIILDSMLKTVCPSEDDICPERSVKRATDTVTDILMSLLSSVAEERTLNIELFISTILEAILENICPDIRKNSELYLEVCDSVEEFVKNLVKRAVDTTIMQRERVHQEPDI